MNNYRYIFTLLLISFTFAFSSCSLFNHSTKVLVKEHEKYKNWIENNKSTLDQQFLNHWVESAEGGETIAYYNKGELVLIESFFWGETGKNAIRYFIKENQLFYIVEENHIYNRPIFWDKELAREFDDEEYFTPEKTMLKTNRYYFENEKLIRWLNPKNKKEKPSAEKSAAINEKWIAQFEKIKTHFK